MATTKRLIDRGLFWLALVVVLAGAGLALSFLAEDQPSTAASASPPHDIVAFCSRARDLSEVPDPHLELGQPATDYRSLQAALAALAPEAPSSIATLLERVRQSFDPVIAQAELPSDGDPDALSRVSALLDAQSRAVAHDGAEIAAYIQQNCGFDVNGA